MPVGAEALRPLRTRRSLGASAEAGADAGLLRTCRPLQLMPCLSVTTKHAITAVGLRRGSTRVGVQFPSACRRRCFTLAQAITAIFQDAKPVPAALVVVLPVCCLTTANHSSGACSLNLEHKRRLSTMVGLRVANKLIVLEHLCLTWRPEFPRSGPSKLSRCGDGRLPRMRRSSRSSRASCDLPADCMLPAVFVGVLFVHGNCFHSSACCILGHSVSQLYKHQPHCFLCESMGLLPPGGCNLTIASDQFSREFERSS